MGTSVLSLGPDAQRQAREQIVADEQRRALAAKPICGTCLGTGIMPRFDGRDCRCPECRGSGEPGTRRKFGNIPTVYKSTQGFERRYDSTGEANYAATLDQGIAAGLVKWWLPQVAFPLPGGVTYRCDFVVQWTDRLAVIDFKGADTQSSINKRKQVKACFGIEVELVRAK
jgi:hypothetical protein